ncbi:MAG: tungstate ABC transporter substrate-binding protein WtpA, partial [Thermofilum sp. ex4484_82]
IAILVVGVGISIYYFQIRKIRFTVLHAGSLTVHMEEFEEVFESEHPNVDVILKAYGSRQAAMQVAELKEECDVLAVADYGVIEELLFPKNMATWYIAFASNEICIAFTNSSKYADEINATNWYEILLRNGVKFGHSDPNLDPCGYRAVIVMKLAEKYYNVPGLFDKLNSSENKIIRPKSVQLPPNISLGDWKCADYYVTVNVTLSGGTVKVGEPILYGVTIPSTCKHRDLAIEFIKLMLGERGRQIFVDRYLEPLDTYLTNNITSIPTELRNDPEIGSRLQQWEK